MLPENFSEKFVLNETVRRVLRRHSYNERVARRKPLVSAINKEKRLNFAKKYILKPVEFWHNVIFCDENKYNVWRSDNHSKI